MTVFSTSKAIVTGKNFTNVIILKMIMINFERYLLATCPFHGYKILNADNGQFKRGDHFLQGSRHNQR